MTIDPRIPTVRGLRGVEGLGSRKTTNNEKNEKATIENDLKKKKRKIYGKSHADRPKSRDRPKLPKAVEDGKD